MNTELKLRKEKLKALIDLLERDDVLAEIENIVKNKMNSHSVEAESGVLSEPAVVYQKKDKTLDESNIIRPIRKKITTADIKREQYWKHFDSEKLAFYVKGFDIQEPI